MHPLGFAYYPDGAHEGVDEIEESSLVYLINGVQVGARCISRYMFLFTVASVARSV